MVRSLAPKVRGERLPSDPDTPREKKRKCVPSACVACRKRKSKCDGRTPACSSCAAVYHTECSYDAETASAKKRSLADNAASAAPDSNALGALASLLKTLPDDEAADLVRRIQGSQDLDALAKSVDGLDLQDDGQPRSQRASSYESTAQEHPGGSTFYGSTSTLRFRDQEDARTQPAGARVDSVHDARPWTTVTADNGFVEHLLGLYFTWCHPVHPLFSESQFYEGFRQANTKYCSPILVNAILAFACHYSDRPEARIDPTCPRTAGDHFFAEAKALVNDDERPFLTTIQANAIMSYREASMGRDTLGYHRIHLSMAMALETGLNLNLSNTPQSRMSPADVEERKVTFWGCFTMDTVWSLCTGRIPALPNAAVSLDRCSLAARPEPCSWMPYGDKQVVGTTVYQSINTHKYLYYFTELMEITKDMLFMFFTNKEMIQERKLTEYHSRFEEWYRSLPQSLRIREGPIPAGSVILPNVLLLHSTYHTCLLQLFAFSLEAPFLESRRRPNEICKQSATRIIELMRLHRQNWTVRRTSIALVHTVLWACFTHIAGLPSTLASQHLVEGMQTLQQMAENHPIAGEGIMIIWLRSKKLGKQLPDAAIQIIREVKDQDFLRSADWYAEMSTRAEGSQGPDYAQTATGGPLAGSMQHSNVHMSLLPSGIRVPVTSLGAPIFSPLPTNHAHTITPSTESYEAGNAPFPLTPNQGLPLQHLYWPSYSQDAPPTFSTMEPGPSGTGTVFHPHSFERAEYPRSDQFAIEQGYSAPMSSVDNTSAVRLARADLGQGQSSMSNVQPYGMSTVHNHTLPSTRAPLHRMSSQDLSASIPEEQKPPVTSRGSAQYMTMPHRSWQPRDGG